MRRGFGAKSGPRAKSCRLSSTPASRAVVGAGSLQNETCLLHSDMFRLRGLRAAGNPGVGTTAFPQRPKMCVFGRLLREREVWASSATRNLDDATRCPSSKVGLDRADGRKGACSNQTIAGTFHQLPRTSRTNRVFLSPQKTSGARNVVAHSDSEEFGSGRQLAEEILSHRPLNGRTWDEPALGNPRNAASEDFHVDFLMKNFPP
jgi:hypothetical protein